MAVPEEEYTQGVRVCAPQLEDHLIKTLWEAGTANLAPSARASVRGGGRTYMPLVVRTQVILY